MKLLKLSGDNPGIVLKEMSVKDCDPFYRLYFTENESAGQHLEIGDKNMNPKQFAEHIMSLCNELFTIRTVYNNNIIIGDCALHHWSEAENKIEIGGSLLPQYWGKGIMATAFQLLIQFAKEKYNVQVMVAKTDSTNHKALKFSEKLGFKKVGNEGDTIILEKEVLNYKSKK
jgi:ribosomal-protein-alanine N-acetyltransferase